LTATAWLLDLSGIHLASWPPELSGGGGCHPWRPKFFENFSSRTELSELVQLLCGVAAVILDMFLRQIIKFFLFLFYFLLFYYFWFLKLFDFLMGFLNSFVIPLFFELDFSSSSSSSGFVHESKKHLDENILMFLTR
jgi:hypothetical protein